MNSLIKDVAKRKKSLLSTALVVALGTVAIGCSANKPQGEAPLTARAPQDKPNVVLIYLDDVGYADIGANNGTYPTPNLDKMASEGVNLESFYAPASVSTPSRAGLLTGRLGARTGIWGNQISIFFEDSSGGLPEDEVTIAEVMRDSGYKTVMMGKWHLGVGKNKFDYTPTRQGFDEWWGIPSSNDMYFRDEALQSKNMFIPLMQGNIPKVIEVDAARRAVVADMNDGGWGVASGFEIPLYHSFSNVNNDGTITYDENIIGTMDQENFTKEMKSRAVEYIQANADAPFFMYLPTAQNHVPMFASSEFHGLTDTPYGDTMAEQDDLVGAILAQLQDSGIMNNTIVIVASDNGPDMSYAPLGLAGSAAPLRGGKHSAYEGGFRTPAIIQWAGQIKPASTDAIFAGYDMLPTIAGLTGVQVPNVTLDGYDMSPVLLQQGDSPRTVFPYYIGADLSAYRSGDWKVLFYDFRSPVEGYILLDKPRLFNLKDDIGETTDVGDKYPEILTQMIADANAYNKNIGEWRPSVTDEVFGYFAKLAAEQGE